MRRLDGIAATARMQEIYREPVKGELIAERLREIRAADVTVAGALSPQRTQEHYETVLKAGVDLFVIRGTTVSAEHVSPEVEPLNLKKFIYDLDVPVIVGGASTYQAGLHLMRTGAAGVLVGFGGGSAQRTRATLGIHAPMATAVSDVAAARRDYLDESGGRYVHVIADGGLGRSGDLVKAFACGADAVMLGAALARSEEAPGRGYHWGQEAYHSERLAASVSRSAPWRLSRRSSTDPATSPTAPPTSWVPCGVRWPPRATRTSRNSSASTWWCRPTTPPDRCAQACGRCGVNHRIGHTPLLCLHPADRSFAQEMLSSRQVVRRRGRGAARDHTLTAAPS
ncbi:hypothetical protein GCM10025876_24940 [Demequina litorisediminis]|uniref:IMP dehydrogenase/GMP reductase domain-containing protein n=1 Tax=Demequina litorisediminis TaxID=1849022 RepID=A0ABQ6IER0_9MICO|nr:hypothetical protein GCM10025876_24940 [Demequina litorisediminis]